MPSLCINEGGVPSDVKEMKYADVRRKHFGVKSVHEFIDPWVRSCHVARLLDVSCRLVINLFGADAGRKSEFF